MAAAAAFGVQLRKTSKATQPQKAPVQLICDGENYQALMEETYLERYLSCQPIAELSFRTSFVALSRDAAAALNRAHAKAETAAAAAAAAAATVVLEPALSALAADIDKARASLVGREEGAAVFVRLSSRSPKDAPLSPTHHDATSAIFASELEWVREDEKGCSSDGRGTELNAKLHALHRATTFALATRSGHDAVALLAASDRIQEDLSQYAAGNISVPMQVAVREFNVFDPDCEMRAFVHGGMLTALTQYNELVFSPWVAACADVLAASARKFLEERVLPVLAPTLPNAVVDLVFVRSSSYDRNVHGAARFAQLEPRVIEVNPLAEFAGTGLFTWERDREVLLGKRLPAVDVRVLKEPPPAAAIIASLAPAVRAFLTCC